MYVPGSILTLKTPIDPDPETGEVYAYNEVKFVAPSPVSIVDTEGWEGENATFCVLVPMSNFGANINRPFGQLRELYEIKSVPEQPGVESVDAIPRIKTIEEQEAERAAAIAARDAALKAQRSPEAVFAEEAPGVAPLPGQLRGRAPLPEVIAPKRKDALAKAQAKSNE